jgi:alpha 1,2-mannosyltransferase
VVLKGTNLTVSVSDRQIAPSAPQNISIKAKKMTLREMLSEQLDYSLDQVEYFKKHSKREKVNGVFAVLVRNSELDKMVHTVKEIERSFNAEYQYPYLFLNDAKFTQEFKEKISNLTTAKVEFGLIPKEHWSIPDWINEDKFKTRLSEMGAKKVSYGGSESYRHMCRFNSGFFYKHSLIQKYDYYWRVS